MTTLPAPSFLFTKWNLNPNIVHLNHGSFGGTPRFIIEKQKRYIDQLESEPVDFSIRRWYPLYYENKKALADFVGSSEHNIYLVPNTTIGINHILHNQKEMNRQWLTTNHAYGACIHAFHKIGEERGNEIIKVQIPYPIHSENEILEQIENHLSPRISLALIDYITSATAIIFPIKKLLIFCTVKV